MKLIREYINEKFTDESDPIHDMKIGPLYTLLKDLPEYNKLADEDKSYNNFLKTAIYHHAENIEARIQLIKLCVKLGADQLFYESRMKIPSIVTGLYRVTSAGISTLYSFRDIKIYFEEIYNLHYDKEINPPIKKSSVDFSNKYDPINSYFLNKLDETIRAAETIKKAINKLTIK